MYREDLPEKTRSYCIRPILVALILTITSEAFLLIYYGIIMFHEGNLLYEFLWTIIFCGIGMGATLGALTVVLVAVKYTGLKAIISTTVLSTMLLGIGCNVMCCA